MHVARKKSLIILALMFVFVFVGRAEVGGKITGVVKDQTGSVIPGATVIVTNTQTDAKLTATTDQEAHMRALLLHSLGGQPLLLKSLKSDDVEHTDRVEVQAILTSTGRQNSLLEQIVSRLSLEPGVSGVSWEIVAEHD